MDRYTKHLKKWSKHSTNPHGFLGLKDGRFIYQFSPNKKEDYLFVKGERKEMTLVDPRGLFVYESGEELSREDYQIVHTDGTLGYDPYSCSPVTSFVDMHLFDEGEHDRLYKVLGSRFLNHNGFDGVCFTVYAPSAISVHLRCDMGEWREFVYPMRRVGDVGIFELFIPGCKESMMYKYHITTSDYKALLKSDPFGKRFEMRPKTATMTYKEEAFLWGDQGWIEKRREQSLAAPMNVYELHLGAWSKGGIFPNFRNIVTELVSYVKDMGYTHVELMPITEYPLDESWGYQVAGYFAPTSRYGTAGDFKYFVNYLHLHGIGVVFDFVTAHFPDDDAFLANFDGTPLFENAHPVMGKHPEWTTLIFDYESKQVVNFLIAAALFWVEEMHVDAIRMDAVQSILYLDFGRDEGEFERNHLGGVENIAGIKFLKKLNEKIHSLDTGVFMIAEDPSLYDGVTRALTKGGLGFSMKWNIGWRHDLFYYLSLSDEEKKVNHKLVLNSYKEIFREQYMLILSHDDVANGNSSLVNRFSEVEEEKFAYLRLLYSVAIAHPGKKLFFMGHEIAEEESFSEKGSWRKKPLNCASRLKHKCFTKEMNHFYLQSRPLYEIDFDEKGFAWIDASDYNRCVLSFVRKGAHDIQLVVHNFSKKVWKNYFVAIPGVISIKEMMNTDDIRYGGMGVMNDHIKVEEDSRGVYLDVPKLGTVICKVVLDDKKCIL